MQNYRDLQNIAQDQAQQQQDAQAARQAQAQAQPFQQTGIDHDAEIAFAMGLANAEQQQQEDAHAQDTQQQLHQLAQQPRQNQPSQQAEGRQPDNNPNPFDLSSLPDYEDDDLHPIRTPAFNGREYFPLTPFSTLSAEAQESRRRELHDIASSWYLLAAIEAFPHNILPAAQHVNPQQQLEVDPTDLRSWHSDVFTALRDLAIASRGRCEEAILRVRQSIQARRTNGEWLHCVVAIDFRNAQAFFPEEVMGVQGNDEDGGDDGGDGSSSDDEGKDDGKGGAAAAADGNGRDVGNGGVAKDANNNDAPPAENTNDDANGSVNTNANAGNDEQPPKTSSPTKPNKYLYASPSSLPRASARIAAKNAAAEAEAKVKQKAKSTSKSKPPAKPPASKKRTVETTTTPVVENENDAEAETEYITTPTPSRPNKRKRRARSWGELPFKPHSTERPRKKAKKKEVKKCEGSSEKKTGSPSKSKKTGSKSAIKKTSPTKSKAYSTWKEGAAREEPVQEEEFNPHAAAFRRPLTEEWWRLFELQRRRELALRRAQLRAQDDARLFAENVARRLAEEDARRLDAGQSLEGEELEQEEEEEEQESVPSWIEDEMPEWFLNAMFEAQGDPEVLTRLVDEHNQAEAMAEASEGESYDVEAVRGGDDDRETRDTLLEDRDVGYIPLEGYPGDDDYIHLDASESSSPQSTPSSSSRDNVTQNGAGPNRQPTVESSSSSDNTTRDVVYTPVPSPDAGIDSINAAYDAARTTQDQYTSPSLDAGIDSINAAYDAAREAQVQHTFLQPETEAEDQRSFFPLCNSQHLQANTADLRMQDLLLSVDHNGINNLDYGPMEQEQNQDAASDDDVQGGHSTPASPSIPSDYMPPENFEAFWRSTPSPIATRQNQPASTPAPTTTSSPYITDVGEYLEQIYNGRPRTRATPQFSPETPTFRARNLRGEGRKGSVTRGASRVGKSSSASSSRAPEAVGDRKATHVVRLRPGEVCLVKAARKGRE